MERPAYYFLTARHNQHRASECGGSRIAGVQKVTADMATVVIDPTDARASAPPLLL